MQSIALLGLQDQNLPVFKQTRQQRLQSINKVLNMIRNAKRLRPEPPHSLFFLNKFDPEWEDRMVYPVMNWPRLLVRGAAAALTAAFLVYNYNIIKFNPRFRLFKYCLPPLVCGFAFHAVYDYALHRQKIRLFEDYCKVRARELARQNGYLLDSPEFRQWVYFNEDLRETLERVHRQANDHSERDFQDTELVLQDFLRRYSDPRALRASLFPEERLKLLN